MIVVDKCYIGQYLNNRLSNNIIGCTVAIIGEKSLVVRILLLLTLYCIFKFTCVGELDGNLLNSVCIGAAALVIIFALSFQALSGSLDIGLIWTTLVFCFRRQQPQQHILAYMKRNMSAKTSPIFAKHRSIRGIPRTE